MSNWRRAARMGADVLMAEPLSATARDARRNVLVTSVVAILVFRCGMSASDATLLGLRLTNPDDQILRTIALVAVIAFGVEFLLYAGRDIVRGHLSLRDSLEARERATNDLATDDERARQVELSLKSSGLRSARRAGRLLAVTVAALDIAYPVVAATVALLQL